MAFGVEGLPFRLLASAVVVALTVPTVIAGLSAFEAQHVASRAIASVESVVRLAQRLYLSGGGAQDVRLDLGAGLTVRLERVSIGDVPNGSWAPSARVKVAGHPEIVLVATPPVPMAGPDGPLVLGPGLHRVRVAYGGQGPVRVAVAK